MQLEEDVLISPTKLASREQPELRVGVFLDYDNLMIGLKKHRNLFSPLNIIEAVRAFGKVQQTKAFTDIVHQTEHQKGKSPRDDHLLFNNGIEMIHCPKRPIVHGGEIKGEKDMTDKSMIDHIYHSLEQDKLDVYVIGTCDKDFTCAVNRIKDAQKMVIIMSSFDPESSNEGVSLHSLADLVIYVGLPELDYLLPLAEFLNKTNSQWGDYKKYAEYIRTRITSTYDPDAESIESHYGFLFLPNFDLFLLSVEKLESRLNHKTNFFSIVKLVRETILHKHELFRKRRKYDTVREMSKRYVELMIQYGALKSKDGGYCLDKKSQLFLLSKNTDFTQMVFSQSPIR